jgi:hypothetical protein
MATKQRRYPLLLDVDYPPEREVLDVLLALPSGERQAFLRTLVLVGHREIRAERQSDSGRASAEGTGGANA